MRASNGPGIVWAIGLVAPFACQVLSAMFWLLPTWAFDLLFDVGNGTAGGGAHWAGFIAMCGAAFRIESRLAMRLVWMIVNLLLYVLLFVCLYWVSVLMQ